MGPKESSEQHELQRVHKDNRLRVDVGAGVEGEVLLSCVSVRA